MEVNGEFNILCVWPINLTIYLNSKVANYSIVNVAQPWSILKRAT